jgi:hypothetical protein
LLDALPVKSRYLRSGRSTIVPINGARSAKAEYRLWGTMSVIIDSANYAKENFHLTVSIVINAQAAIVTVAT